PLPETAEADAFDQLHNLVRLVFVRAFGPDSFCGNQIQIEIDGLDSRSLRARGHEVHLDSGLLCVPERAMLDSGDVEVSAQLSIDPREKVQVERRGDTQGIVIGEQEVALRLHQVGADQQRIALVQNGTDASKNRFRARPIEVADVRAEKQGERHTRPVMIARKGREALLVFGFVRDDREIVDVAKRSRRSHQSGARDIDQMHSHVPGAWRSALYERAELFTAARTQFHDRRNPAEATEDLITRRFERPVLRPRDPVPGKQADGFEQRRPESIVEVSGWKLTWIERQIVSDVAREIDGRSAARSRLHLPQAQVRERQRLLAQRNVACTYGYRARNQLRNDGRISSLAVAGDAPFMTKCSPSKKSAEYSGYEAIGGRAGKGANR